MSRLNENSPVRLNLLVIYVADLEVSCDFYRALGLTFVSEQHGSGPVHHAAVLDGMVVELYPRKPDRPAAQLRLGFQVAAVDSVVQRLQERGVRVISAPKESPWGRRAVVEDPDGHSVELVQVVV